ncbi:hypothetical protein [Actinokineospora sp. NBRC 105648]|uniref:hypothetical protein n=1 Tax=Actinokineospora sp. NBRC 105648 TaxID=3032206 RepID=UPI0024A19857|nr:hypothetical protein [Actinokineospora sp. NBRC 105648]GLZ42679.1 hypothetical protein Acsp05_63030 [Actinokineospora sp. NBRC 105648]
MADTGTDIGVVPDPATDRPAAGDPTTEVILSGHRSRHRWLRLGPMLVLQVPLYSIALVLLVIGGRTLAASVAWAVVLVGSLVASVLVWRQIGWVPRGAELLTTQAWRPVTTRVVRVGWESTVVEIEENGAFVPLTVRGLPPAHRAMISRTGRAWLVGPAGALCVFRVDGAHAFWPAVVRTRPLRPAAVVEQVSAAEVSRRAAARARLDVLGPLAVLVPSTPLGGVFLTTVSPFNVPGAVMWLAMVVLAGVLLLLQARYRWAGLRLPGLVEAGEWVAVSALLGPWRARLDGTAEATAVLTLPDGETRTARLPGASVDLLGTVWETGALWFAGQPEPGTTRAAGFPGYPLLAVAKIGPGQVDPARTDAGKID